VAVVAAAPTGRHAQEKKKNSALSQQETLHKVRFSLFEKIAMTKHGHVARVGNSKAATEIPWVAIEK
jgi:hypothetical protein